MHGRAVVAVVALALAGAGGYAYADAADVVPGWITDAPIPPDPQPFPSASLPAVAAPAQPAPLPDDTAPLPDAATVQAYARQLRADSRIGASTNVAVVDIATGEVLADLDADDPQIPASNVKLLTATALLLELGPDYRLRTSVTWNGQAADSGRTPITLVAGGDMLLTAGRGHGDETRGANGYAGLEELAADTAAALADAGVTSVTLSFSDAAFVGPAKNPVWPSSAFTEGYVAPSTGMAINVGKTTDDVYPPRYDDPSANTAEVFAGVLRAQGIDVKYSGEGGARDVELAGVGSAPLAVVLEHMLVVSDNTVAEVLGQVLAIETGRKGSTKQGIAQLFETLTEYGVDMDGVSLVDFSGYSREDRLTATALTDVLVATAADPELDDMLDHMAIGGWTGTLATRFTKGDARALVRAKTGSLGGISSLSGTVVTADGRWLAFAVLADQGVWSQEGPREAIDAFVEKLASCGCSG